MAGTYELKATANGEFMFNLKAGNGQVILTSERYSAKAGAVNGIESVRTNSPVDDRYERRVAKGNGSVALIDRRTRFTGLVSGFGSDHSGELIECGRET